MSQEILRRFARVIFLDFDGVLHPSGGPPGESLPFCWVPDLAEELEAFPDVGIVVHSSWIERFTMEDMREFLGPLGTFMLGMVEPGSKAQAITSFLATHPHIRSCLVIDDDATQFGATFPHSTLICNPRRGLSDPKSRQRLREWLGVGKLTKAGWS